MICADVEGSRNSADVRENRSIADVVETYHFFRRAGNQISGSWYEMLLIWLSLVKLLIVFFTFLAVILGSLSIIFLSSHKISWSLVQLWSAISFLFVSPFLTVLLCSCNRCLNWRFVSPIYIASQSLQGISYTTLFWSSRLTWSFGLERMLRNVFLDWKTHLILWLFNVLRRISLVPGIYGKMVPQAIPQKSEKDMSTMYSQ